MNVAVTGLNATDNPGPGVPVIRSLRDHAGFAGRIIGLLYDTLDPGAYWDGLTDRCYLFPYPSTGLDAVYERIEYIHSQEKLDALLPTLDTELYGFYKLAPRLKALGIHTLLPSTEQLTLRGKDRLASFSEKNNIKSPQTKLLSHEQELRNLPSTFSFPLLIKGIFYDAYLANSADEAITYFHRVRAKWGLPIIVQERILGDEFNVVALGDGSGGVVGAVAMRKTYITDKGKGWAGVTIHDPVLQELSYRIVREMRWTGGMELEFIRSRASGEYFLLEINPRFPAWVYLATAAGQNLPGAWLDLTLGKTVKPYESYDVGKMFVRCAWDIIADLSRFEKLSTAGEA